MDDVDYYCEETKVLTSASQDKLEKILWKLLEPDFGIKIDLYLNLLFTQWVNKSENDAMAADVKQEINELFFHWIVSATNLWNENKTIPSTSVLLFAIHVGCQLRNNENFFARMNASNVFQKLAAVSQVNQDHDTGVTTGFIMLLSSVLDYATGVEWLLTTAYWNDVINIALRDPTKYIKKKAYQFIIKLLETTVLLNEDFCKELVEILAESLNEAAVQVESIEKSEDLKIENKKMHQSLKPSLDLVLEVADTLLKNGDENILKIFIEAEVSEAIQNILNFSQLEDFSLDLLKIRFAFLFYQLCGKLKVLQQATLDEDTLSDIRVMFDLIQAEIEKGHVGSVIKICYYAHGLYSNLNNRIPICVRKGESIEFQTQMMLLQLFPVMTFSYQLIGTQKNKQVLWTDDLRHDFFLKFSQVSAIRTLEIISRWQKCLTAKPNLIEDATLSLQYILKSKKIINKEQAAFIFRPLTYCLKDLIWRLEVYRKKKMPPRGIKFISMITDTIIDLVNSFDLTWRDSIETISMIDIAFEILQHEYVDYQVTVKILELLNMSVSRYMSPNMVLLMGNASDSVLSQIGTILYSKCNNENHQIRNAGLEIVYTLALNAETKFPEFTNVLFNAELPQLVVKMALNDNDHYVRAAAIKCLQAMILVEDIWELYQSNKKFWENIQNMLVDERKGSVRKEAATLVYCIYKKDGFPEKVLPRIYDIMTHAAVADIHWEVKCNALSFWSCTLKNHLREQGMVDRGFPTHIFSKEKRKIITLTETEIKRRVIKVLSELSEIGCLYVLKTAALDGFDEEVSKSAMALIKDMVKMFKYHKIAAEDLEIIKSPIPAKSYTQSYSSSSMFLNSDWDSNRSASLESSESQYLDSSGSNEASFTPSPQSSPNYASSSDTYNTKNMHYINNTTSYNKSNSQRYDNTDLIGTDEELDHFDIFDTVSGENYGISENDVDLGVRLEENNMESSVHDIAETEKMFDELLKLNNSTLIEEICNPGYQVKTSRTIKSKEYISSAEYFRFCLEIVESNEKKTIQLNSDLDEFSSVLDDLLKEYDLNSAT